MEDLLPSELCTICHAAPPKYRCPRCSTRTCSLPCTRRHKKWAQCSGVRDPTRYLKRDELVTPKGIDHDFNFLTGIERTLDRAEHDAERRGIELQEGRDENCMTWRERGFSGPAKGETRTRTALQECQVVVQRAPKGMARGKQNRTAWHKKRRTLIWTVEWILNDGASELGTCPANAPIAKAYAVQFPNAVPSKKQKRPSPLSAPSSSRTRPKSTVSPRLSPSDPFLHTATTVPASPLPTNLNPLPLPSPTPKTSPVASFSPSQDPPLPSSRTLHFYLLHPGTPSPTRVLIPLSSDSTLATSLRHRVVLEFPTVYALRYAPEELPTGFFTEEEYFKNTGGRTRASLIEATLHDDPVVPEADDHTMTVSEGLNAEQLLDVLKRDLGVGSEIWNDRSNQIGSS